MALFPAHAAILSALQLPHQMRALNVQLFNIFLIGVLGDERRERRMAKRIEDARRMPHPYGFDAGLEHLLEHIVHGDVGRG